MLGLELESNDKLSPLWRSCLTGSYIKLSWTTNRDSFREWPGKLSWSYLTQARLDRRQWEDSHPVGFGPAAQIKNLPCKWSAIQNKCLIEIPTVENLVLFAYTLIPLVNSSQSNLQISVTQNLDFDSNVCSTAQIFKSPLEKFIRPFGERQVCINQSPRLYGKLACRIMNPNHFTF